jgi:glycosyltransferase involved in cell wall biosynthesis
MEKKKIKLSIIVPCYNEEKNILPILEKFNNVIHREDVEVVLVNNGSTDNSKNIFDKHIVDYKFAKLVNVDINKGYGFGITSGLKEASGEFIGYTHADMQTDPADVLKALEIMELQNKSKDCYVKGDRKGRPLFDQLFTMGMSAFETMYLGKSLWDINAQPNIFHRSFFDSIKDSCPKDFSLDLYFLYTAQKLGLNVVRFSVLFPERIHGKSSWNTGLTSKWKFIKRTISFSIKLKKEL